jgi:hypothetical protein
MNLRIGCVVGFLLLSFSPASLTFAQTSTQTSTQTASALPRLVRFGSTVKDLNGKPLTGVVGITFALYSDQTGGAPLWLETQNVTADNNGHYTALLGSTKPDGLPAELFTSEQARWVGVQVSGQPEQPRVLLVSAPYALKAGDAETVGGLPPSAFVLAVPLASGSATSSPAASAAAAGVSPAAATDVTTTGGTANYLPLFNAASTVIDSTVYQSGTGATAKIGINTASPATALDVNGSGTVRGTLSLPATGAATATAGKDSQALSLSASAFSTTSSTVLNQVFHLQAEPASNNTASPSGTLNLLFGEGATAPSETGLKISSRGLITFAAGQTFPGTGTITGITTAAGSGLAGGGTKGALTLSVPAAGITNAMLAHPSLTLMPGGGMTGGGLVALGGTSTLGLKTCAANQVLEFVGGVWTCNTPAVGTITGVTAGTDLTGGGTAGTVTLNLDTTKVPLLGAANTFTGNQTVNGVISGTSNAFGVSGSAKASSGFSAGVGGTAASPSGYGVEGVNTGSGGIGVYGYDNAGIGVSAFGVTGVSAGGTSYGVNANATGAGSTGVYGTAPQFGLYGVATGSGNTVGVFGAGADGLQGSGTVHGVYAASTGAGSSGVYATAPAFGLYGVATATSGNSVGVFGSGIDGLQGSGSAYGVYGAASAAGSTGVYGTAPQFGLYGVATASSGNTVGVFGSGADGLQGGGTTNGVYANGGKYGVQSFTSAGIAGIYGVYGGASGTGRTWLDNTGSGGAVWADTISPTGGYFIPALLATTDNNEAAVLQNNSNDYGTIYVYNYGSGGTGNVVRAEGTAGSCTLSGGGDAACTGTLKSVVATASSAGARRVETYSMQSPENWFEDAGTAQLVDGTARVNLESVFEQTVNTGVEYHVFLTPDGDCKGLYVSAKTASGFEVRELGGGTSSIPFEYRIMAKRVGYEKVRLADVTERFNQQEARSQKMRRPVRSSAEPRSGSQTFTLPTHPSAEQQYAPKTPMLPVPPSAAPRPAPVAPKLPPMPPVRAALHPLAAQPK